MGGRSNGSFVDRTYTQPQPRMFDNNIGAPQPMPTISGVGPSAPMTMSSGMQGSWAVPQQFVGQPTMNTGMPQRPVGGGLFGMPQQPQMPSTNQNPYMAVCG